MKFGLFDIMQVPPETPSHVAYAEHLADAELGDRLGLDFYFSAERHFMPFFRTPAPSVWLGGVAVRTSRIRIGVMAYTLPVNNPVRLAEEVAMLDHLSGGRMEVGVGLGHRVEELASLGVDPAKRLPLTLEGIVLMQRAWRGAMFDHPGEMYRYRQLYVDAPVQRPHPPLWFAGNDPMAAQWAARNGLSLAVGFQPTERLLGPCAVFDTTWRKERSDQPRQHLALMRHLYVAESDEEALEQITEDVMHAGDLFAASPREFAAAAPKPLTAEEARVQVLKMRQQDVVIAGGPASCARAIAASTERLMADVFLANPYLTGVGHERVQRTIRLFATEVVPRVRELRGSESPSAGHDRARESGGR